MRTEGSYNRSIRSVDRISTPNPRLCFREQNGCVLFLGFWETTSGMVWYRSLVYIQERYLHYNTVKFRTAYSIGLYSHVVPHHLEPLICAWFPQCSGSHALTALSYINMVVSTYNSSNMHWYSSVLILHLYTLTGWSMWLARTRPVLSCSCAMYGRPYVQ